MHRLVGSNPPTSPCACGQAAKNCAFWSGLGARLPAGIGPSSETAYDALVPYFQNIFGHSAILLDANKTAEPLRYFALRPDCEVFVIHLIRDVRGACVSEARRKKKIHPSRAEWFTATQAAFQWMRKNHAISSLLTNLPLAGSRKLGYEVLCQRPDAVLEDLRSWLGVDRQTNWLENHALIGNQLGYSDGLREIVYDTRWKTSRVYYPAFALFPILPLLNRRWVYS